MADAALGIVTCLRPQRFANLALSIEAFIGDDVPLFVFNASGAPECREYELEPEWAMWFASEQRATVGQAKNWLLRKMLAETDAAWLFLAEDDIYVRSREAIDGYIRACQESRLQHLNFALHGPLNRGAGRVAGAVTIYPHYVGAWSVYSRKCLEEVGLFDEAFRNAWEHVEHSARLELAGHYVRAADATGSDVWLGEQLPVEGVIGLDPEHDENMRKGMEHWQQASPATFAAVWG